jgi:glycosyltransferase involved in cell wall biosynthesis
MKRKKLVIISHTEHYLKDGEYVGWGSTINEVNYLADYWNEVVHVACLHKTKAPNSSLPYTKNNIKFSPIPNYGGDSFLSKVKIISKAPRILYTIYKNSKGASEIQLRLPTSMGLYLLPFFKFFMPRKFTFWVKYAGDWGQKNPPLANKIQRYWLKKNWSDCKVTINGFWPNQPKHCYSFENPCLTQSDITAGRIIAQNKNFSKPFTFCFVGRFEDVKGVSILLEALKKIPTEMIDKIHLIGDGQKMNKYMIEAQELGNKVIFHGFLENKELHQFVSSSHFLLLPSKAEGFPKVVAEAACYGTISIVSNVGSISHYIDKNNGFLWDINDKSVSFDDVFTKAIYTTPNELKQISINVINLAELFTFDNYLNKLKINMLK